MQIILLRPLAIGYEVTELHAYNFSSRCNNVMANSFIYFIFIKKVIVNEKLICELFHIGNRPGVLGISSDGDDRRIFLGV